MKILIVEDDLNYKDHITNLLHTAFGVDINIIHADDYLKALQYITIPNVSYDLVTMDLNLPKGDGSSEQGTQFGMDLLEIMNQRVNYLYCCRMVVTEYPSVPHIRDALNKLHVDDFIDRRELNTDEFDKIVKRALFEAKYRKSEDTCSKKYILSTSFTDSHLTAVELLGPDRFLSRLPIDPYRFDATDLSSRADRINIYLKELTGTKYREKWRDEARSIGKASYEALTACDVFNALLQSARELPRATNDLWLRFRGSRVSLEVPFELLYDHQDYLTLQYPIYRQVLSGPTALRKVQPFRQFLRNLVITGQEIRILLIASNVDPKVDAVDKEVVLLEEFFRKALPQCGLSPVIDIIDSSKSSLTTVKDALTRCSYHIVHYAGHGTFNIDVPERSSLYFRTPNGIEPLPASTLKSLMQNSQTYLFFLSACFGAKTAEHVGHGDFYGIMDSILQADIPSVVGYRWVVDDPAAMPFAVFFYEELFSTFSLQDAMYKARFKIMSERGRDDSTWASPLLVVQTPYDL